MLRGSNLLFDAFHEHGRIGAAAPDEVRREAFELAGDDDQAAAAVAWRRAAACRRARRVRSACANFANRATMMPLAGVGLNRTIGSNVE